MTSSFNNFHFILIEHQNPCSVTKDEIYLILELLQKLSDEIRKLKLNADARERGTNSVGHLLYRKYRTDCLFGCWYGDINNNKFVVIILLVIMK